MDSPYKCQRSLFKNVPCMKFVCTLITLIPVGQEQLLAFISLDKLYPLLGAINKCEKGGGKELQYI